MRNNILTKIFCSSLKEMFLFKLLKFVIFMMINLEYDYFVSIKHLIDEKDIYNLSDTEKDDEDANSKENN